MTDGLAPAPLNVAVIGCAHGELDDIYRSVNHLRENGTPIDLVLICGDFQAVRNPDDLMAMSCPAKFRSMRTFYKYYSGQSIAPVLTIFIGGNHEASSYNMELFPGGWAAPNIYFMGVANVVRFAGLRIAGLSGIYKSYGYRSGYFEQFPLNDNHVRSVYHIREYDVVRMRKISSPIDIFMSHDWPVGITAYGDCDALLRRKPFFQEDVHNDRLGNPETLQLLKKLKPSYWLSAHLHVKFAAVVPHSDSQFTKFLALDKCLEHRDFLQVLSFPNADHSRVLSHDPEWLAISRAASPYLSLDQHSPPIPDYSITPDDLAEFSATDLTISPQDFVAVSPAYVEGDSLRGVPPSLNENPQATAFYNRIGVPDPFISKRPIAHVDNPDEINIDI